MTRVFLAEAENWQAVYIDGELLYQDHRVDLETVVEALGHEFESRWFDDEDFKGASSFPYTLEEWGIDDES